MRDREDPDIPVPETQRFHKIQFLRSKCWMQLQRNGYTKCIPK